MTDLPTIGDHRWDGYNPNDLIKVVNDVRSGPGATAMNPAIDALKAAIQAVADMDSTLRDQLAKLGIDWQSTAGTQAQATVTQSADYARAADPTLNASAQAVDMQGESHSLVKNTLPDPKALSYDRHYQNSFGDGVQHFFGYETDHDKQVKQANAAKAIVVQQMNSYTESTRTNLASYQPLPAPPAMNLQAQPVDVPSGNGGGSAPPLGQPGYFGGNPVSGGGGAGSGGGGGFSGFGGTPGGGAPEGGRLGEGGHVGVSPIPGRSGGVAGGGGARPPAQVGGGASLAAGAGAVLSAGAGIGAGAAALAEGRGGLGRSGRGSTGGVPGSPEGSGAGGRGQGPGGTLGVGAEEEGAAGRPGRLATGGTAARGSSPMMQPAAMNKGDGEEDKEHIRKYAVESSDVFDDERLVVPTVIGDVDAPQQQPQQQEQEQQRGTEPQ